MSKEGEEKFCNSVQFRLIKVATFICILVLGQNLYHNTLEDGLTTQVDHGKTRVYCTGSAQVYYADDVGVTLNVSDFDYCSTYLTGGKKCVTIPGITNELIEDFCLNETGVSIEQFEEGRLLTAEEIDSLGSSDYQVMPKYSISLVKNYYIFSLLISLTFVYLSSVLALKLFEHIFKCDAVDGK